MARLAYGSDVRGRKAKSAFKARILRRLGDYVIHQIWAADPFPVPAPFVPTSGDDVDMGHRTFRATRSQSANFNRAYGKSLVAVVLQLTDKKVNATTLKDRPHRGTGHGFVVPVFKGDRPHAETFPEIVHEEERILQKTSPVG